VKTERDVKDRQKGAKDAQKKREVTSREEKEWWPHRELRTKGQVGRGVGKKAGGVGSLTKGDTY